MNRRAKHRSDDAIPPDRTSSGVETKGHIVPLVRRWLRGGVSSANLRSSVRIQDVSELAGGLKSPVVGAVTVSVQVVVKQGSDELLVHECLMNAVNQRAQRVRSAKLQKAVFPEVMRVERIEGFPPDRDHLMIQQALVGYESVHDLLYGHRGSCGRAAHSVERGLPALELIHRITPQTRGPLKNLPRTPDPFTDRLASRLRKLRSAVSWLPAAFRSGVTVDGHRLPPLTKLLRDLAAWQTSRSADADLRLVHGDPHIANLMARRRGKSVSVRWIDPNPTLGLSDPAYDWGKLLHFVEPLGWAKQAATAVATRTRTAANGVSIRTWLRNPSPPIERVRLSIEKRIRNAALKTQKERKTKNTLVTTPRHCSKTRVSRGCSPLCLQCAAAE